MCIYEVKEKIFPGHDHGGNTFLVLGAALFRIKRCWLYRGSFFGDAAKYFILPLLLD